MRAVYQSRRALDSLHLPYKAVGVDVLDGARPVESRELLLVELPARGPEVVLQLFHAPGPDYGSGDGLFAQEPVQRDLGVGLAGLLGDLADHIEGAPVALRGSSIPMLLHRLHGLSYA